MTSARESEVLAAARALVAKFDDTGADYIAFGDALAALRSAVALLDAPIGVAEVLAAYREERAACAAFVRGVEGDQAALLLAWDEARERYGRLLTEYAEGSGLTTRKAERALAAHLASFVAREVTR